ncbi:MAG: 23S rRNA pseudouridylate synthase, partial [Corynebacterium sp.]|nr:23S rRNA pseudouridylate synthase [Corynebacterium sp.]
MAPSVPLPVRDGLNPSRIRVPAPGLTAGELLCHVVLSQRRRHPNDGVEAVCDRFARGEVLL